MALIAVVGVGILLGPKYPDLMLWNVHAAVWVLTIGYCLGVLHNLFGSACGRERSGRERC